MAGHSGTKRKANEELTKWCDERFIPLSGYISPASQTRRNKAIAHLAYLLYGMDEKNETLQIKVDESFDNQVPYITMNYFDRFMSRKESPLVEDEDAYLLPCFLLAWKIRSRSDYIVAFLSDRELKINKHRIKDMEIEISKVLNWEVYPVIPFSTVDHYLQFSSKFINLNRNKINAIILESQGDICFTKFRPTVVAAAAIIAATEDLSTELLDIFPHCKESLSECLGELRRICKEKDILSRDYSQNDGIFKLKWLSERSPLPFTTNLFLPERDGKISSFAKKGEECVFEEDGNLYQLDITKTEKWQLVDSGTAHLIRSQTGDHRIVFSNSDGVLLNHATHTDMKVLYLPHSCQFQKVDGTKYSIEFESVIDSQIFGEILQKLGERQEV